MENKKFRHLDLFSGIGGFALAASWVWGPDHEIVSFCEIEPFPQKVLKKHWPAVPIHDDIKTLRGDNLGRIDLVSGGFPCQPYSVAGKQRGSEDDRALWPEMFRIIKEAKPDWIIGENVAGFINMGLDDSISDLESAGYETTSFIIPACGIKAKHQRARIWMVANSKCNGLIKPKVQGQDRKVSKKKQTRQKNDANIERASFISNALCERLQIRNEQGSFGKEKKTSTWCKSSRTNPEGYGDIWEVEPGVGRVANGISSRVDRIKGLGNAIVPQVVVPIMQSIKQIEELI